MKGLLTYAFLLQGIFASAQYTAVSFHNISLNEGLSQSSVVDIAMDTKGFVWLATQDGLNRYDGKDFLVLDKRFDDLTSGTNSRLGKIVPGLNQSFWIIAKGGYLERFSLINNTFQSVPVYAGKVRLVITCVLQEKNEKLWIGTENGKLLLYNCKTDQIDREIDIQPGMPRSAVNMLFKDQQQRLWVVGSSVGYLDGDQILNLSVKADELKTGLVYSCLTEDKEGNLWLGSLGGGLFFKKKNEVHFGQFRGFSTVRFPADLVIEAIFSEDKGKLWIGTYGKGLFIIDPKEEEIGQFVNDKRNPSSIPFNDILSIKQDKDKGIWIGTDGGGLSYFNANRNNFILFNNQTVPEKVEIALVRSITTDKRGNIWAGTTNKGLTRINYQKSEYKTWELPSYQKNIYNPDRIVSLFYDKKDILWIGTQGNGLILWDSKKEQIIKRFHPGSVSKLNMPDGTVWCMYPTAGDKIWVGSGSSGLCLMDKQNGIIGQYKPGNQGSVDAIRAIVSVDDSTLCIAFEKTGIQLFNTITRTFYPINSRGLNAFFSKRITIKCLYYHQSVLWIGTGGKGILAYNRLSGKTQLLTEKEGLPNNTIYGILSDARGYLWVSTNKGLSRFSPDVLRNKARPSQFTNYVSVQGLQSNEFNTGAYFKAPNGMLLFGGINGLNLFDPAKFKEESKAIPVVFTKILVDNEPVEGDTAAAFKKVIKLNYKNHSVAFNFAALDFFSSPRHYYYKLEGYDKNWIDGNQRNYVSYSNVPTGKYSFQVKYTKRGVTEGKIAKISVNIKGPFWEKWWFILLLVLLFIGLIYTLYRYRIAQVFKLVQIRQRIATDLHDDIGSTLSNINILAELSKNSLENPARANTFLDRISEEVQASSQSLDDIIWSVNTQNDNWEETFSRMRRYAAEVFENSRVHYTIKLIEQAGITRLNMEKRRDIFLIYKELINNINKHSEATEVEVEMWFQQHQLVMLVHDNGKGFDKQAKTHRNGLKNLSSRVTRWKGSIAVESDKTGTCIKIII
ncbi:MAG: two-component regulator propeller domain-containing protein [Candidatus Pedobacter colombiensis]|uniref:Two-component regulator propeller domain-containing protein n=1 Tax=Candidatus Pedobacter colombiensis TaxID=3121371 RepID=A0AAJ5W598_9SPHI|nr:sensor histidine kinase [Pedobacter sp.]WEK17825.1 MAG: two-component regulator propeller domain-containing protein [Pedobacter sp.]